jgi:hypothetical protein
MSPSRQLARALLRQTTAPLTRNQPAAFPEIEATGATVVGKGKPGLPGNINTPNEGGDQTPMSIRKTRVVDSLGIEKGSGDIVLTVIDDEGWTNEHEHLHLLQEKLNSYLAFLESGEVYEQLATELGRTNAKGLPIKVSILAKYPLPAHAQEFLRFAQEMFSGAGFSLTHRVLLVPMG